MKTGFKLAIPALLALAACDGTVVIENSGAAAGTSSAGNGPSGSGQVTAAGSGGADVGGVGGAAGGGGADVGGVGGAAVASSSSVGAGGGGGCAPGMVELNGQCVPANISAPCLGGGNALYVNGEPGEYIHAGPETFTQGKWSASTTSTYVGITLLTSSPTMFWHVDFASKHLPGSPPLAAQLYTNAMRYPFEDPGSPGMTIAGNGGGCNKDSGQFQIETITFEGEMLKSFTATFEQRCDGIKPLLRGCVHFEQ